MAEKEGRKERADKKGEGVRANEKCKGQSNREEEIEFQDYNTNRDPIKDIICCKNDWQDLN